MAVKIRLARRGAKKRPYYNIVVSDAKSPRDGKFIEIIGSYSPLLDSDNPSRIKIVEEKAKQWIKNGAQPTDTVAKMFKKLNISI